MMSDDIKGSGYIEPLGFKAYLMDGTHRAEFELLHLHDVVVLCHASRSLPDGNRAVEHRISWV